MVNIESGFEDVRYGHLKKISGVNFTNILLRSGTEKLRSNFYPWFFMLMYKK